MDGERARIADIGDVIEELQRVDELAPRLLAALELEADEAALPALEIFLRALFCDARSDAKDGSRCVTSRPLGEPARDGGRVGAMALDAQRQSLDALQGEEGVERRHRRAEVAQERHARLDDVGDRAQAA